MTWGEVLPRQAACRLGEGLYVTRDRVSWLDIHTGILYLQDSEILRASELPVEASLILGDDGVDILLASGAGLGVFDTRSGRYRPLAGDTRALCKEGFRTNDGCRLSDGSILVGTMHREKPGEHPGSVIRLDSGGEAREVLDEVHIPNTFVELPDGSVLISDSHIGIIYRCQVLDDSRHLSRQAWYQSTDEATPDGGCLLPGGLVAVAMWDGGCVRVLDASGERVGDIDVPARRPTNARYDQWSQALWVTSACEGLSPTDLEACPLSGETFRLDSPLDRLCR